MTTAEADRLVERRSYLDSNSGRDSGTGLNRVFCMEGDSAGGLPSTLSSLVVVTTAARLVERGSSLDGLGVDSGSGLDSSSGLDRVFGMEGESAGGLSSLVVGTTADMLEERGSDLDGLDMDSGSGLVSGSGLDWGTAGCCWQSVNSS